jgi:hypothetical protein
VIASSRVSGIGWLGTLNGSRITITLDNAAAGTSTPSQKPSVPSRPVAWISSIKPSARNHGASRRVASASIRCEVTSTGAVPRALRTKCGIAAIADRS